MVETTAKTLSTDVDTSTMSLKEATNHFIKENFMEFVVSNSKYKITPKATQKFITHCVVNNLNPIKGEVYGVPFYNKESKGYDIEPVTSYKVYVKRSQQSGLMNGMDFEKQLTDDGKFKGWKVTIHRKGWDHPFTDELTYSESVKRDAGGKPVAYGLRKENPAFMVKKQLIRQSLPIVFADVMDGTHEEITSEAETDDAFGEVIDGM